ncbi:Zeta-crystallin [Dactylella cylindrospora]|nr:Zeta-crystallin [Dactylella cylindrospora]
MVQSKSLIFSKIPEGLPVPGQDLTVQTSEVDITTAPEGGVVVKVLSVSVDPYMRGRLRDPAIKSYSPAFDIGKPIYGEGIGKVIETANPDFPKDTIIKGALDHSEYIIVPAEKAATLRKINNPYNLPLQRFLGALGMPGATAYSSLYEIGELHKSEKETIFISAAAGAVGSLVGQLAKREGLRIVGSAGSDEKVKYLVEKLGFDAAFNYKTEKPLEALQKYIPEGLDIYYDNVGGETLAAAIENAKQFARFIECGMISQYNIKNIDEAYPFRNLMRIVSKRLKIQGFIVGDIYPKYAEEHQKNVAQWLHDGAIHYQEDVTVGIDNEAEGFVGMLSGKNFGKAVIKYADN